MMKHIKVLALAVTVGLPALALATGAHAANERVQNACREDYLTFCGAHPVGSTGLRRCMEANGRQLSRPCINALVDAGDIPRKFKR